jgi:transmembrane sensor
MAMNKHELSELIHRVRTGAATNDEKELLERHWQQALNDRSALDEMQPEERERLKRDLYLNISDRLGFPQRKVIPFISLNRTFYKVAASILVICAAAGVWYLGNPDLAIEVTANTIREIRTNYGERLTVTLPDQSSVVLNGNSKLRFNENWSESSDREVWIDGEGFFAVQHTKSHQKFVVHTGEGLDVEVLGTKFNVKSREHSSEVLLTEGKVKLNVGSMNNNPVYLEPGELATVKENKLSKRVVADKQYTSWVRSKLFFDQMTLLELSVILHDTYGLNVTFENEELKSRQLSGEISSATADDILFAIAETFNIQVTRKANDAIIFSLKQE